jgi:hypothetical protein
MVCVISWRRSSRVGLRIPIGIAIGHEVFSFTLFGSGLKFYVMYENRILNTGTLTQ